MSSEELAQLDLEQYALPRLERALKRVEAAKKEGDLAALTKGRLAVRLGDGKYHQGFVSGRRIARLIIIKNTLRSIGTRC